MKKFVIMHMGFEMPSPEIMEKWNAWFASIKDNTVENLGFRGGKEVNHDGTVDLGMDADAITGISIVEAADLDAAVAMTEGNPFIKAVRVYETMSH